MTEGPRQALQESWHAALYRWSYSVFDATPPQEVDRWSYGVTVATALLFIAAAGAIFVALNLFTLFFGVYAEPVWREKARLRFLTLPGGIPVIALCVPVLFGYALWWSWTADGPLFTVAPFAVTVALGFGLLACFVVFNRLRRRFPRVTVR